MRIAALLLSLVLTGTAQPASAQDHLELRVTIPARLTDGDPLVAFVDLVNASGATITVPEILPFRNLVARVRLPEENGGCMVVRRATWAPVEPLQRRLAPGDSMTASVDLAALYPLGLRPGTYEIEVEFTAGARATATRKFEVIAPAADRRAAYEAFIGACNEVLANAPRGPESVLAAASAHHDLPFRAPLVELARGRAGAETRGALDRLLVRDYHGQPAGKNAALDLQTMEKQRETERRRTAWESSLREEKERAPRSFRNEIQTLTTIDSPDDFTRYEEFVEDHPDSAWSALAVQRMIAAVERGITPPGADQAADVLRGLYRQLLERFPESVYAEEARESPRVQQLLRGTTMQ